MISKAHRHIVRWQKLSRQFREVSKRISPGQFRQGWLRWGVRTNECFWYNIARAKVNLHSYSERNKGWGPEHSWLELGGRTRNPWLPVKVQFSSVGPLRLDYGFQVTPVKGLSHNLWKCFLLMVLLKSHHCQRLLSFQCVFSQPHDSKDKCSQNPGGSQEMLCNPG